MENRTAREYLESMSEEPQTRKAARELVSTRLNGVEWRWRQRVQHIAHERGEPDATVEHPSPGVTVLREAPTTTTKQYGDFFSRFFQDPDFWDAYGQRLADSKRPQWAKRRRANISLWIELLVRGETTPKLLAAGDEQANFAGFSEKNYDRLLTQRADPTGPPFLLDGPSITRRIGQPRSWGGPHATRGAPSSHEVTRMFDLQRQGYLGLPAQDRPSRLAPIRESNHLHPHFARSFVTLRDELLQRIGPLLKDEETAEAASVLRDDIAYRWWPLRSLHDYISQDIALEWWLERTDKGREETRAALRPLRFTPRIARQLIEIHKASVHPPHLTDDGIALLLIQKAGSMGWRQDPGIAASSRIIAADAALTLKLSSRIEAAILIDAAGANVSMGRLPKARTLARQARNHIEASDEYLLQLAGLADNAETVRIHAQSVGGSTYLEIIGMD